MPRPARVPEQVIELLQRGERHAWTMEQIAGGLQAAGHQADFSSVYRAVERLLQAQRLARVPLGDGAARYELAGEHHDHVRCVRCKAVAALDCVLHDSDLRAAERASGWSILEHRVVLDGLCPQCRSEQQLAGSRRRHGNPPD
jgi:Fur family ferric uptake transcriptional regulator